MEQPKCIKLTVSQSLRVSKIMME